MCVVIADNDGFSVVLFSVVFDTVVVGVCSVVYHVDVGVDDVIVMFVLSSTILLYIY